MEDITTFGFGGCKGKPGTLIIKCSSRHSPDLKLYQIWSALHGVMYCPGFGGMYHFFPTAFGHIRLSEVEAGWLNRRQNF